MHALKEAHRRTLDILRQQSDQELQTLRFELEDEGKAKLGEDSVLSSLMTYVSPPKVQCVLKKANWMAAATRSKQALLMKCLFFYFQDYLHCEMEYVLNPKVWNNSSFRFQIN